MSSSYYCSNNKFFIASCSDLHPNLCVWSAAQGDCDSDDKDIREWHRVYCPRSCGMCPHQGICSNENSGFFWVGMESFVWSREVFRLWELTRVRCLGKYTDSSSPRFISQMYFFTVCGAIITLHFS